MVGEVAGAGAGGGISKVVHEGWMVRYGRRKIGKSYFHTRYFVLDPTTLAYYKKKPTDNMVPLKTLVIDGNCRVEDRGLKTQQGHMVYVLCIYNKKENHHRMMMAAYNIQDALSWKEKIEFVIDQQHGSMISTNDPPSFVSRELEMNIERNASSSSPERIPEDEEEKKPILGQRTSIGNSPPDIIHDWTFDTNSPRKNWQLVRCQNGLRIFEELLEVDYLPRSYSKAMKAVGAVDATCEAIFELIMSLDGTRYEWDCSFQYGSLVEEVDGHTAVLYQRLQLHWCSMVAWPRDLCYVRYWRRNDDGSYVVLFRSRVHPNCGPQPGFVRAHIESGGFKISPLKSRNGRAHTQVQYLMQIDLRGWFIRYFPSFQQHCLLQMLNCVAGIRELFSQTDEINTKSRIPIMVSVTSISSSKVQRTQEISIRPGQSLDQVFTENRQPIILDDDSDDDDDNQLPEAEEEGDPTKAGNNTKRTDLDEDTSNSFDTSCFSGNLRRDDDDNSRNCWRVPDGNIFKIRGANFFKDKSKKEIAKGLTSKHFGKDTCRKLSHGVRSSRLVEKHKKNGPCCSSTRLCSPSCFRERTIFSGYKSASLRFRFVLSSTNKTYYSDESSNINKLRKIPGSTHYSMVFYYVKKHLEQGSLLQRFVDGDDEFRNSRFKLIPSVPKGSWIVRQSVGNTPCLLGKAVDCSYIRGENYLEIDVDIGSSAVANGVLGLVFGVLTSLVVDMAFLIQQSLFKHCCSFVGPIDFLYMLRSMIKLVLHRVLEIELAVTPEELPERLVGAARVAHVELSSADFVDLAESPSEE